MGVIDHASGCMAVDADEKGVGIKSDRQVCWCLLALEGQVGAKWTRALSEKKLHSTTNLEGGEERWKEVTLHGCSTGVFAFVLKFLLGNLVSLDSGTANGARSPPETPRS